MHVGPGPARANRWRADSTKASRSFGGGGGKTSLLPCGICRCWSRWCSLSLAQRLPSRPRPPTFASQHLQPLRPSFARDNNALLLSVAAARSSQGKTRRESCLHRAELHPADLRPSPSPSPCSRLFPAVSTIIPYHIRSTLPSLLRAIALPAFSLSLSPSTRPCGNFPCNP